MKRIIAAWMAVCCLLLTAPTVLAEPVPEEEILAEEAVEESEEAPVEEEPEEEPAPVQQPVQQIDPLSDTTALKRVEIICLVDGSGETRITQNIKMNVIGVLEEITFAFPGHAKNREVEGWRTKSFSENGIRYLTISSKSGFSGEQSFTLSYTVKDTVSAGEESQKLTVPLLEAQKYPVGVVALAVNLPKTFASMPVFSSCSFRNAIARSQRPLRSGVSVPSLRKRQPRITIKSLSGETRCFAARIPQITEAASMYSK